MRLANYIKAAFLNRWNLLVSLGLAGFAALSGHPDVLLPLVLAGEVAYLGLLSANPKFQKYVDAQAASQERSAERVSSQAALNQIMRSLPESAVGRFESLRAQCQELRQIAANLRQPGSDEPAPLDDFQVAGLDRLLWIYLRLLYTEHSLSTFLRKTREADIQVDIQRLEERLGRTPATDDPQRQRMRKTLEDNLATSRDRLANLAKARDNYELITLEIERLENKIRSLSEMAINRHEPEFVSGQVDQVASSMLDTERTMNELQFVTGLDAVEDEPPELLRAKAIE